MYLLATSLLLHKPKNLGFMLCSIWLKNLMWFLQALFSTRRFQFQMVLTTLFLQMKFWTQVNKVLFVIHNFAVRWVEQRVRQGCKVLVHCRAGIGRSGSIGIAYLFYSNPELTYKQTLEQIWKVKNDIFPHKDLEATLEKLFPRKKIENHNS